MSLPNPSMSFSPFAILTAEEMNNLVENDQALAAGTGLNNGVVTNAKLATGSTRLGFNRNAGATLPITYTTYATVTASSTGRTCEAHWEAVVLNGGSGATRTFDVQVLCDGVAIQPFANSFTAIFAGGEYPRLTFSFTHESTPTAGSHTWALQLKASAANAVILNENILRIQEIA